MKKMLFLLLISVTGQIYPCQDTKAEQSVETKVAVEIKVKSESDDKQARGNVVLGLLKTANPKVLESVKLLFDSGFDPKVTDDNGDTALHLIAKPDLRNRKFSTAAAHILLDAGSCVHKKNKRGQTPLAQLCSLDSYAPNNELISLLLESGAHVNEIDEKGLTPLAYAIKDINLSAQLLTHGADILLKGQGKDAQSALERVLNRHGYEQVEDIFLSILYAERGVDDANKFITEAYKAQGRDESDIQKELKELSEHYAQAHLVTEVADMVRHRARLKIKSKKRTKLESFIKTII